MMNKSLKLAAVVLLVTGVSLLLVGYECSEAQEKVVKIGLLAPLTGSVAEDAQDYVNGATMAIEEINGAGGVVGYKFKLEVADVGEMETDKVKSGFERLVKREKVDVILTGYASRTNFEIDLARENEIPYLLSGNVESTERIITKDTRAYPTVYSIVPSYKILETDYAIVIEHLIETGQFVPVNKKVAIITSDNPYSRSVAEGVRDYLKNRGWTISLYETVPFGPVLEWGALLAKIRSEPPGAILLSDYLLNNGVSFLKQFLENPTNSFLITDYTPQIAEFPKIMGDQKEGTIWHMLGDFIESPKYPKALEWLGKYKKRFGYRPGKYGATLYDEVYIYAEALKKVKDPKKHLFIGDALLQTDYMGNGGRVVIDVMTHLAVIGEDYQPWMIFQWQGDKKVMLFPEKYAGGKFRYQPWMKRP